jgi:hypothetical protein
MSSAAAADEGGGGGGGGLRFGNFGNFSNVFLNLIRIFDGPLLHFVQKIKL